MNWLRLGLIILTVLFCGRSIQAATINGSVSRANGQPLDGVLVTLFDSNMKFSETVYTNTNGRFLLESRQTGETILRLRSPGFADQSLKLNLATRTNENLSLTLAPFADIITESNSLPASAHFSIRAAPIT